MLLDKLKDYTLILASSSPRRQQFLRELRLDFQVRIKEIEEHYPPELCREEIPLYIARSKAVPFLKELRNKEVLITADTLIWFEGEAIGKPRDYADALATLTAFSGKTHEVITAVCLTMKDKQKIFCDTTEVTFAPLTSEMINYYLTNYHPFDKAGSYGIQEWIGAVGITQIKGSYNNVVGFPTYLFYRELMDIIEN